VRIGLGALVLAVRVVGAAGPGAAPQPPRGPDVLHPPNEPQESDAETDLGAGCTDMVHIAPRPGPI
jgi:hypothetical protein